MPSGINHLPFHVKTKSMELAYSKLMSRVEITPSCWIWVGKTNSNGYGLASWYKQGEKLPYRRGSGKQQKSVNAHRLSYALFNGPIGQGMEIDHLCRVRNCVNPMHLESITREENIRRGVSPAAKRAAQTHCLRGHLLAGDNLAKYARWRVCRICVNLKNSEGYHRRKAEKKRNA
jgi:hypothetical protein